MSNLVVFQELSQHTGDTLLALRLHLADECLADVRSEDDQTELGCRRAEKGQLTNGFLTEKRYVLR
jgi:hypothetical protein